MLTEELKNIVEKNKDLRKDFLSNLLKEYLELVALNFIYNSKYAFLIFKGGSCLRICFNLPRLSEDLDFDYEKPFKIKSFFNDLIKYFKKEKDFPLLEANIGKERLYLKFPILKDLGVSEIGESDKLYLKIELSQVKKCSYQTEIDPIFQDGFSFLVCRFSKEDLMAGKICAALERVWFKGKDNEIKVKGRDFFDLYWFMKQKIVPNYECIFYQEKKIKPKQLWKLIQKRIAGVNPRDLEYDLMPLIKERKFVKNFCQSFKNLFNQELRFYKS